MFLAYLIVLEAGWKPRSNVKSSDFDGSFFRAPIKIRTKIQLIGSDSGWNVEVIEFFSGRISSTHVAVAWTDSGSPLDPSVVDKLIGSTLGRTAQFSSVRSKLVWLSGDPEGLRPIASQFLRESQSLTSAAWEEVNKFQLVADAKGVAVIDNSPDPSGRARRLTMVIGLSCAYLFSLDKAIDELAAQAGTRHVGAEKALRDWSSFLAEFYFHEPVKASTIELIHFYSAIRDRQRINVLAQEVTEQLNLIANLAQSDRIEGQNQKLSRIQKRVALFGVVLTAVSLFQVTPLHVTDFFSSWSRCLPSYFQSTGCQSTPIVQPAKLLESNPKQQINQTNPNQKQNSKQR